MAVSPGSTSVGLVGLGNLGLPLASMLVRAGWSLTVLDVVPDRVQVLVERGAAAAEAVSDLADCDVLVLVVPDDAAVGAILDGPDGYLAAGRRGRAVVVHSTVLPETAQRLAGIAAGHGVALVDAPVSGGAERAESGTLAVMAGGEEAAVAHVRPLLEAVGDPVLHVGPVGAGAATKLANQLTMFANLAGMYEAIDFAAAHGVATDRLVAALSVSLGDSWVARNLDFWDRMVRAYDAGGTPVPERPWSKDLAEVVQAARAVGMPVPIAGYLAQTLAARIEAHAKKNRPPLGQHTTEVLAAQPRPRPAARAGGVGRHSEGER